MAQLAPSPILVHAAAASPRRTGSAAAPQTAAACISSWSPRAASHAVVRQGRTDGACSAEGRSSKCVVAIRRPGTSRRCTHVAAASGSGTGPTSNDVLRVSLPTNEAQRSIKFALARAGRETAVIIDRLSGGSAAAEAGLRPGQRLLSISDPMSATGMWDLNDRPSIRFVRDTLAMRSSDTIDLVLSRDSMYAPGASMQSQMSVDEIDTGADAAASSKDGPEGEAKGAGAATSVSQQLAQQYQERQAEVAQQQSAFERRQRRRREYYEKESARDDGSFFAISAAVILLPAIAILAIAFFSGYLDRLSDSYSITR